MTTQLIQEQMDSGAIPESLFLTSSSLKLYPFLVRRKNAKDYLVMRLGCRTVTVVSTTYSGIVACRLLKSGSSPGDVSAQLSSMFHYESADIQPLLKALYKARMIRAINGEVVEADPPSLTQQMMQHLQWFRFRAGAVLGRLVIRTLPVAITHRAMCLFRRNWHRAQMRNGCAHVQRHLASVFGGSLTEMPSAVTYNPPHCTS